MLPTPGSTIDIPVIRDVVDIEMTPLLCVNSLDGDNRLVENVTSYLGNHMTNYKNPVVFKKHMDDQTYKEG